MNDRTLSLDLPLNVGDASVTSYVAPHLVLLSQSRESAAKSVATATAAVDAALAG